MSGRGGGQAGPPDTTMRLFVAVQLPESWLTALADIQQSLRRAGLALRYVRPEGIHLTVRFLGETPASRVAAIERALASAAVAAAPFNLRLGRLGTFGPARRPRVVWVGVEGDSDGAGALHAAVERALEGAGIAPEGRSFNPHLTLARVPERLAPDEAAGIGPAIAELPVAVAPAHEVDTVALMRSELGRGGARYTALKMWRLGG